MKTLDSNEERRRVSSDRRKFTYTAYSPERRSGIDRRQQCSEQQQKMQVA